MNRILKIVGYAVMLFLVYIGSISMLKSCKGADSDGNNIAQTEDGYTSDEEIYDEFFESDEDAEETQEVASSETSPEYVSAETEATEYDDDFSFEATESEKKQAKASAAKPAVKSVTKAAPKPSSTTNTGPGGNYLVVAGSYLIRDNAQKMVEKLKNLGYSNAEIVSFDESKYHSISAGRYNSYDSAGDVAKALKQKGIDCYVHTRK